MVVRSALRHAGAAKILVHRLKYQGLLAAADPLAGAMVTRLPSCAAVLVPVPRVRVRRWRYGVDPAVELATAVGLRSGLPVLELLAVPWWSSRHAGRARRRRGLAVFAPVGAAPAGSVLIDDVLTTGATLASAAVALGGGVRNAVTATAA
ncbi:MAG: hypothetical protein ACE5KX_01090 [Acidimicrobiia bacterium]